MPLPRRSPAAADRTLSHGSTLQLLPGPRVAALRDRLAARHLAGGVGEGRLLQHLLDLQDLVAAGRVQPEADTAMHFGVRFRIASLTKPVVSLAASRDAIAASTQLLTDTLAANQISYDDFVLGLQDA
mgnify:CR=1 FL=1